MSNNNVVPFYCHTFLKWHDCLNSDSKFLPLLVDKPFLFRSPSHMEQLWRTVKLFVLKQTKRVSDYWWITAFQKGHIWFLSRWAPAQITVKTTGQMQSFQFQKSHLNTTAQLFKELCNSVLLKQAHCTVSKWVIRLFTTFRHCREGRRLPSWNEKPESYFPPGSHCDGECSQYSSRITILRRCSLMFAVRETSHQARKYSQRIVTQRPQRQKNKSKVLEWFIFGL